MNFLKRRAPNHAFFQCDTCRNIDEVVIHQTRDGKSALALIVKEYEDVLKESIESVIGQLQNSATSLSEWRESRPDAL